MTRNITPAAERIDMAQDDLVAIRKDLAAIGDRLRADKHPWWENVRKIEKRIDSVIDLLENGY